MRMSLAVERERHARALEQDLSGLVKQLCSMPAVQKVILFGSYAAGSRDLFTDLDLLVVMHSEKDFVHRTAELYQKLAAGVDLDLLVYTPAEFERLRERGFVREALKTGKVLYEKERPAGG